MVPEASLKQTDAGLVPAGEGWYVVNAREAEWHEHEAFGRWCHFEGDVRFSQLGINVSVLLPGQPSCMYHRESNQEDFLILAGDCRLLVEGEERPLKAWDFFHCPPWTEHVFVGGSRPCLIVAVGGREKDDSVAYPVVDVAERYGAGVPEETTSGQEAYARFPQSAPRPYEEGDLPDW
jgi:uncharacterized cupin superfamily protein